MVIADYVMVVVAADGDWSSIGFSFLVKKYKRIEMMINLKMNRMIIVFLLLIRWWETEELVFSEKMIHDKSYLQLKS